jgi:5S rRNA maturation endonuclease (ribonuclease M5)
MTFAQFKDLLAANGCRPTGNDSQFSALCPAHDDHNPSLSVSEGRDGRILVYCHAGCLPVNVFQAVGLRLADSFPEKPQGNGSSRETIVATYDYIDERGNLLYQNVRYLPKGFKRRRPDGHGGWIWSMTGVERRVLYRLPQTLAAIAEHKLIVIVEGEKDVESLITLGFAATTSGNAGSWKDEFAEIFRGVDVCILPDKDKSGRGYGVTVAQSLSGNAHSIRMAEVPGEGNKDISDFIASGGTTEQIQSIIDSARAWTQETSITAVVADSQLVSNGDVKESEFEFANKLAAVLPPICTCEDQWHAYNDGTWKAVSRAIFRPEAQKVLPVAIRTENRATALLNHLEGRFQVSPDSFIGFYKFDSDDEVLLNCRNGIVRVTPDGVTLLPHAPGHNFTAAIAASFSPAQGAPLFHRVLAEALPDEHDRALLQVCAGNFLYPSCRFEVALIGYGEAGMGKSTTAELPCIPPRHLFQSGSESVFQLRSRLAAAARQDI